MIKLQTVLKTLPHFNKNLFLNNTIDLLSLPDNPYIC